MRPLCCLIALHLAGCTAGPVLGSSDVRIDTAPETGDPDSRAPRLCVAPSGEVYVVWSDDREGVSAVWLNRSTDGGTTWLDQAVRVSHGPAAAVAPEIACDDDFVHVTWEDARDGELENHNIYYNRSEDGGITWNPLDTLLTGDVEGEAMALGPQMAIGGDDVFVTWFDNRDGAFDIYVAASTDAGQSFAAPLRLDGDPAGDAYSAWPRIVADDAGHVVVVWEDSRDGASDIYATSSADHGATFLPDRRLDTGDEPGSSDSFAPFLAADGQNVHVVWHDRRNGERRDVFMNYSLNHGVQWKTEPERVDTDSAGFYDSLYPQVAVHTPQEGRPVAHVVWQDARASGYDTFVRDWRDDAFSEAEYRVDRDAPGAANSLNPRIARDGETLVVVWEDRRADGGDGYNDLYYNHSLDGGLTWGEEDLRVDSVRAGTSQSVEVDVALRGGKLHVVWADGRNGNFDIYVQVLPVGEEAIPIVSPG